MVDDQKNTFENIFEHMCWSAIVWQQLGVDVNGFIDLYLLGIWQQQKITTKTVSMELMVDKKEKL